MNRISDQPVLLADTGPFCRCAEAGEVQVRAAGTYLQPNTSVVQDVARELAHRAKTEEHRRLASLDWVGFPAADPITITEARILSQIESVVQGRRRNTPGHHLEDRGEVATIFVAHRISCAVLMDDGWGKKLAASKGVTVFTTQDLACELAATAQLSDDEAFEIYRRVYRGATRAEFDLGVAARR